MCGNLLILWPPKTSLIISLSYLILTLTKLEWPESLWSLLALSVWDPVCEPTVYSSIMPAWEMCHMFVFSEPERGLFNIFGGQISVTTNSEAFKSTWPFLYFLNHFYSLSFSAKSYFKSSSFCSCFLLTPDFCLLSSS